MKKTKQDREADAALREIKQALDCAEFDQDGFRIHTQDLLASGQTFFPWLPEKGMGKQELAAVLAQEYARECRWAYEYQRDFVSMLENTAIPTGGEFQKKWPVMLLDIVHHIFPLRPLEGYGRNEILGMLAPRPATNIFSIECGTLNLAECQSRVHRDYLLSIDWSKGPEAVERNLLAWIKRNAPRDLPTNRGRNNAVDRFNELAAYRARRAGMDHISFAALVGRTGGSAIYSDQPQFLRATRATARRLKKFDADCRRLIALHRKKNK
jgi:hypothetical protein